MSAVKAKNIVVGILSHAFVRIVSIFKSVADTSVAEYDEIVIVMDVVSIKTNTIATNVMSTASIKQHSKKVKDCYIQLEYSFISDRITMDNY